jgi:hypothetical protein
VIKYDILSIQHDREGVSCQIRLGKLIRVDEIRGSGPDVGAASGPGLRYRGPGGFQILPWGSGGQGASQRGVASVAWASMERRLLAPMITAI